MVRVALRDTRTILGEVPPGSALYEQIYEIFNLFSGRLGAEDDANDEQDLSNIDANSAVGGRRSKKERTLDLLSLPKLVNYFRVANSDDQYFDDFIDRVSILAEQEYYVDRGLSFEHLLAELHEYGFLIGCELTEKEPESVAQAQVILQILLRLRVIDRVDLTTNGLQYKDVNDLEELTNVDQAVQQSFAVHAYFPLRTVWCEK